MSSLVGFVFNTELSLIITIVTSFVLSLILLLIKVPNTDYSRKISKPVHPAGALVRVPAGRTYRPGGPGYGRPATDGGRF